MRTAKEILEQECLTAESIMELTGCGYHSARNLMTLIKEYTGHSEFSNRVYTRDYINFRNRPKSKTKSLPLTVENKNTRYKNEHY